MACRAGSSRAGPTTSRPSYHCDVGGEAPRRYWERIRRRPTSLGANDMIRPATIHDVPRIQAIINSHAELGKMLFKSLAQLYEDVRDFGVYELPHAATTATACGAARMSVAWR